VAPIFESAPKLTVPADCKMPPGKAAALLSMLKVTTEAPVKFALEALIGCVLRKVICEASTASASVPVPWARPPLALAPLVRVTVCVPLPRLINPVTTPLLRMTVLLPVLVVPA
jgi:hypothetical protein